MTSAPKDVEIAPPAHPAPHAPAVDGDDGILDRPRALLEEDGYRVSTADLPGIGPVRHVALDAILLGLLFRRQAAGLELLARHAGDPSTAEAPVIVHAAVEPPNDDQRGRLLALARLVPSPTAQPGAVLDQMAPCLRPSS